MTPTAHDPAQALIFTGQPAASEDDCACDEQIFTSHPSAPAENDCACVEAQSGPFAPPQGDVLFQKDRRLYAAELPGGFTLALSPISPNGPAVLNQAAWQALDQFEQPRPLHNSVERKLAESGLLSPVGVAPTLKQAQPQQLTAWLHITNACNLACPYCYVRKSSETMSAETGRQALQAIFRTARQRGFEQVKLKYAGGEASLHFELVQNLHAQARQLAQQYGLRLQTVLLSNGSNLGPAQAAWLKDNDMRLMISLDGVGANHDQLRASADGTGTFAHIERCVDELLLPGGVRPIISVTLTGRNAHGAADVVRWALVRGLAVSLNFYRPTPETASQAGLELEEQQIIAGMQAAYRVFEEFLPERPFFNGLLDRFRIGAHARPCGVGQGYVVITPAGKLAECHMQVGTPRVGGLEGDLIAALQGGAIHNLAVEEKTGCQKCLYRYFCAGGCPLEAYRARQRWNVGGPNCAIYQALAPAALRLEGLRLLKSNGYL